MPIMPIFPNNDTDPNIIMQLGSLNYQEWKCQKAIDGTVYKTYLSQPTKSLTDSTIPSFQASLSIFQAALDHGASIVRSH